MRDDKFDLCLVVKEQILDIIGRMDLIKNNQLPSENHLAQMLEVSRGTIRTVLATLEDEGKVFRRHGSGTYANPRAFKINTTLYPQTYFTELIRNSGYAPSIQLVGTRVLQGLRFANQLGLTPEDEMLEIRKVFLADGKLGIYCIDYLDKRIFNDSQLEILHTSNISIFKLLAENTNIKVAWDMINLEATDSYRMPELQPFLPEEKIGTKPFLLIDSTIYDIRDNPVLYSRSCVNTDIIKYYLVRQHYENLTCP